MSNFGILKLEECTVVYAKGRNGYRLLKFEDGEPIELTVIYNPLKELESDRAIIYSQLKFLTSGRIYKRRVTDRIFNNPIARDMFETILCDNVNHFQTVKEMAGIFAMNQYTLYNSEEYQEWSIESETSNKLKEAIELLSQHPLEAEHIPNVDFLQHWMQENLNQRWF